MKKKLRLHVYGLIQSNNSACSSDLIISDQIEQNHLSEILVEMQNNKFSNLQCFLNIKKTVMLNDSGEKYIGEILLR